MAKIKINQEETQEVVEDEESQAKKKFRALVEAYKVQNPVKYESKKAALERQLNELK